MRAALTIPLCIGGELAGAIWIADMSQSRLWTADLVARLRTLGEIFANALERRASGRALAVRLEFERLLADLSVRFANLEPESVDDAIHHALERLLDPLDVDRSTFLVVTPETGHLRLLHCAARQGRPQVAAHDFDHAFPWWSRQVRSGSIVVLERVPEELPVAAINERAYLVDSGVRSSLGVPLRVGGRVTAVIAFADFRASRRWPDELVSRLRTLGEIFAHAVERTAAARDASERLHFERLLADLSATFANLEVDRVEQEIGNAMRRVLQAWTSTGAASSSSRSKPEGCRCCTRSCATARCPLSWITWRRPCHGGRAACTGASRSSPRTRP